MWTTTKEEQEELKSLLYLYQQMTYVIDISSSTWLTRLPNERIATTLETIKRDGLWWLLEKIVQTGGAKW